MSEAEKQLARIKFQLKIHQSDGTTFQTLFGQILQKGDPNFRLVKPQGPFGDRKNDGFVPSKGIYYQVYAPEDLSRKIRQSVAKCKNDFVGLKAFWNSEKHPIKEFYFVANDKYKGFYPELEKMLLDLTAEHKLPCKSIGAKQLEDLLFLLKDEDIIEIIEFIPDSGSIELIDYSVLNEVITHLLKNNEPYVANERYKAPDYSEKIKFNVLSSQVADLLTVGTYQVSVLEDYFEKSSSFLKQEVRDKFSELYKNSKHELEGVENASNLIFFAILDKATPKKERVVQNAVLVLMSYYFETCDIFEEPQ